MQDSGSHSRRIASLRPMKCMVQHSVERSVKLTEGITELFKEKPYFINHLRLIWNRCHTRCLSRRDLALDLSDATVSRRYLSDFLLFLSNVFIDFGVKPCRIFFLDSFKISLKYFRQFTGFLLMQNKY